MLNCNLISLASNSILNVYFPATNDEDDSDMYMEPDELPAPKFSIVKSESRVVRQFSQIPERTPSGFVPINRPNYASVSRVGQLEPEIIHRSQPQNPVAAEQNFFPSFFRNPPVNAHSRPYKQNPSTAASIAGRYSATTRANQFDQSILGSGDFAVVRGGTFYPDDERPFRPKEREDYFGGYFNNGHGRPQQQKQPYYPEDPFANFKDFADINAGSDTAFSHFIVIYANKNGTKTHPSHPSPKNIFEQLQLLDQEKEQEKEKNKDQKVDQQIETEVDDDEIKYKEAYDKKLMKLSKYKTKLAKTKVIKKYKKKLGPKADSSPDYTDPLLATS